MALDFRRGAEARLAATPPLVLYAAWATGRALLAELDLEPVGRPAG